MKILKLILVAAASALFSSGLAATGIRCNFSGGIPSDWILIDADGCKLSPDVVKFGFNQGDAWVPFRIEAEDNVAASSTSWYSPSGTSSDWMILPALEVTDGASLAWRAKAADARFADGYAVYIVAHPAAVTPEAFLASEPVFSVAAESGDWTARKVDLAPYAGKTVRIAFVNNSTDCSRLFIDDIEAGEASPLAFENTTWNMLSIGSPLELKGFVTSSAEKAATGVSCTLEIGGETFSGELPDFEVRPGERLQFAWTSPFSSREKGDYPYTFTVKAGGVTSSVEGFARVVANRIVMEEGTGTWCPNCVRGIVAMESLAEKFPDNFVGVSIHNNDPMETETYTTGMVFSTSGIPKAKIMRTDTDDPSNIESYFRRYITATPAAGVDLNVSYDESTGNVSAETSVSFAEFYAGKDYNIACAVIENNVHHPGDSDYDQSNLYAGGENGEMGGWEDKPNPVRSRNMWYQEVARRMITPFGGESGLVPASMKSLEKASHTFSFALPSNVENPDETEIVVFLIDAKSKAIVAAEKAPLKGSAAVDAVETESVRIVRTASGLRIDGAEEVLTEVYAADGTLLARGGREVKVDGRGIVIVAVRTATGTVTRKIVL